MEEGRREGKIVKEKRGGDGGGSRYRRSRSRSNSGGRRERAVRQLYIGNIPYTVSESQLRKVFRDHGEILRTTIPQNFKVCNLLFS